MTLKLVIFDLDGTLLEAMLDFDAIRAEIGLPPVVPILETMAALEEPAKARAWAILERHEAEAAARSRLMPGARELLAWLRDREIKTALLTRNSRASVERALFRHGLLFDALWTREDGVPKPDPDGVQQLMKACGAAADESVVVGDYRFDIEAGRAAGVRTIAVISRPRDWAALATWTAGGLEEVRRILQSV